MRYQITDGFAGEPFVFEGEISQEALDVVRVPANPSPYSLVDRIKVLCAAVIHECGPIAAADPDHVRDYGRRAIDRVEEACLLAIEGITNPPRRPRS